MKPLILGHRGAAGYTPENTETAFRKALEMGADGVEFDVHLTADGTPVVIHDEEVDRTTDGEGYIREMTLADVKKLDAGTNFSAQFAGEGILTLMEVLKIVRDCRVINIELKNGVIPYPSLEEKVLAVIKEYGIGEKVIVSSFNHYSVHKFKEMAPEIRTGLLYMSGLYQPWVYAERMGVEAIHPFYQAVSPEIVSESHKKGLKVNVFGANEREDIKHLIDIGVDMIITDYPDRAMELRK